MMSRASLTRRAVAALLGLSLVALLAPNALAKSSGITVTACLPDSTHIQMTMTWSGITADAFGFGYGTRNPRGGLGYVDTLAGPTSSGSLVSDPLGIDASNPPDTAGGTLFLGGFAKANIVASKTLHRGNGWPAC